MVSTSYSAGFLPRGSIFGCLHGLKRPNPTGELQGAAFDGEPQATLRICFRGMLGVAEPLLASS